VDQLIQIAILLVAREPDTGEKKPMNVSPMLESTIFGAVSKRVSKKLYRKNLVLRAQNISQFENVFLNFIKKPFRSYTMLVLFDPPVH